MKERIAYSIELVSSLQKRKFEEDELLLFPNSSVSGLTPPEVLPQLFGF